jgi:hypothetical protein
MQQSLLQNPQTGETIRPSLEERLIDLREGRVRAIRPEIALGWK